MAPLSVNISLWPKQLLAWAFSWFFLAHFEVWLKIQHIIQFQRGVFCLTYFTGQNVNKVMRFGLCGLAEAKLMTWHYWGQIILVQNIVSFLQVPKFLFSDNKHLRKCTKSESDVALSFWLTWLSLITVCDFFCFGKMVCGLHFDLFLRCLWSENKNIGTCRKLTMGPNI